MAGSNITEKENKLVEFWEKNKIFEKSVDSKPKDKQYLFYDGPPFATGTPHYGHILGLTSKDLFPRFWTMKGHRVERRWGWDCHGLPIENIAEKDLKIKQKKEIEEMGIKKFNEFCRSKVLDFAGEWKKTVRRMGKWIDFDNSYKTMDNSYMESVWNIFKKLYDKGYIYEGKKVLLFCPRCQTPLSNTEIAMDKSYKTITEKTATAKFKLKGEENTYFLAWTTTPWTLIGNVALAINAKLDYVKVEHNGELLILVKDRLETLNGDYKVVDTLKGEKLIHKEYEPLYHIPSDKKGHYVINGGDEVTSEDGTGIVHMALYGEFDYEMVKKYDLPVIQHLGHHGKLHLGPKEWIDTWFKKADEKVLNDLEERSLLYDKLDYSHEYPFCYRCETPLFYNAVNSWFVDIQKIKAQLLKKNKQINWYPKNIKEGQFKHIVETAPDWSISRNRFWATSIPVWKCNDCEEVKVIGSIKELQENSTKKLNDNVDLHKHIVDDIKLNCKCGKEMERIPEVLDCWFESGAMPFAAKHYPFENKELFEKNFPCDFVSEYVGQVRAWFYYMHVISVLLFDKAPFKNVVVSGNILASDGSKMSKSKKNYPDPNEIFEKYGADSLRFYLMSTQLMKAQDLNFHEDEVKEVYRKVVMLLSNIKSFYELSGNEKVSLKEPNSKNILDKWCISQTNSLIKNVTESLEGYDTPQTCREIASYIETLSKWYVRRSRDRFKSEDKEDKANAIQTLAFALHSLSKVMAPITPFISEEIQLMFKKNNKIEESVHLESWPRVNEKSINKKLNEQMTITREIVSRILEEREKAKISVRQPLSSASIISPDKLNKEFIELILDEVNLKKLDITKVEGNEVSAKLDTKITKELELEGYFREVSRKVQALRKKANLVPRDRISLVIDSDYDLMAFKEQLMERVGAVNLAFGALDGQYNVQKEEKIKDYTFKIAFNKL
ncbi:isoleucine--tRNA ligase [Candidatus Woesearchaeota archaeon]|nr:isoleucine--tRNA ligase [Candidatus Woesearchaeota archaeon]